MRVLVSGNPAVAAEVAAALRARGADVVEVTDLAKLPEAASDATFDSYVQLPAAFEVRGDTAIGRVHHFYAEGVLARFRALDAVLASLTPVARVALVLGQLPPEAATADDRAARRTLCQVLAHAAAADSEGGRLAVRILESGTTPTDIAFVALGGDLARQELMARLSTMNYADWRVELMGLATVET